LLRAAAVGGAAYFAGKGVARRQADQQYMDDDQEARISTLEQQQAAGPPVPQQAASPAVQPVQASQPAGASIADQLTHLAEMHQRGDLTDEEFAAAKAGVLGTG
jgi:hypothetical protein